MTVSHDVNIVLVLLLLFIIIIPQCPQTCKLGAGTLERFRVVRKVRVFQTTSGLLVCQEKETCILGEICN